MFKKSIQVGVFSLILTGFFTTTSFAAAKELFQCQESPAKPDQGYLAKIIQTGTEDELELVVSSQTIAGPREQFRGKVTYRLITEYSAQYFAEVGTPGQEPMIMNELRVNLQSPVEGMDGFVTGRLNLELPNHQIASELMACRILN